jgi:hypothetical protein
MYRQHVLTCQQLSNTTTSGKCRLLSPSHWLARTCHVKLLRGEEVELYWILLAWRSLAIAVATTPATTPATAASTSTPASSSCHLLH